MTADLGEILRPPKVNVTPQVTAYASKGGVSIVFAQFDLGIWEADRASAVLHVTVERNVGPDCGIEGRHGLQKAWSIDAVQLCRKVFKRVGLNFR